MAFFPMFFDLEGKNILVVGAGIVGSRRIDVLIQMGALVTVVASSASESVIRWSKEGKIQLILSDYRKYRETQILQKVEKKNSCEPLFMILAVTGDLEVDELAASDGR
ncbi:MAG: NAD(P)-dependent oxidoreductase, partial [Clostridium sp.]